LAPRKKVASFAAEENREDA